MINVTWKTSAFPNDPPATFVLDDRKSWKGKLIRGYDIAEMISDEVWANTGLIPQHVEILSPAAYKGVYSIAAKMEPTFSAKRVDNVA